MDFCSYFEALTLWYILWRQQTSLKNSANNSADKPLISYISITEWFPGKTNYLTNSATNGECSLRKNYKELNLNYVTSVIMLYVKKLKYKKKPVWLNVDGMIALRRCILAISMTAACRRTCIFTYKMQISP